METRDWSAKVMSGEEEQFNSDVIILNRGSVQFNSICAGDPRRAVCGTDRNNYNYTQLMPRIPVQPISWGDVSVHTNTLHVLLIFSRRLNLSSEHWEDLKLLQTFKEDFLSNIISVTDLPLFFEIILEIDSFL